MKMDEPLSGRPGGGGSTDFGNVSQVIPAFEMRFAVSEEQVAAHSREMTETAITDLALSNALLVAKTLSLAAGDPLRDATLLESAKIEFAERSG